MIVDFRPLNIHCRHIPVQYDDVRHLRHLWCHPVMSVFSFDLMDGYFHVPIDIRYRHFLQFHCDGEYFESLALPLGWNQSPAFFVKVVAAFFAWLQSPMAIAQSFCLSQC